MKKFLSGSLVVFTAAAGVYIVVCALLANVTLLQEMPDADLIPELEQLVAQERYADAVQLGNDLKRSRWHCNDAKLDHLLKSAEDNQPQITEKVLKFIRGFLTGSPDSAADASGAIVADLVIYGDLRDLVIQGGNYITGNATDPIITGSSSAGLATEALPFAGWFPAALKLLRKSDAFSSEFADHLQRSLKFFKGQGRFTKEDRIFISDLYSLIGNIGIRRSFAVMRHIHSPAQLMRALLLSEHSPEELHLTVRATGGRVLYSTYRAAPWQLFKSGRKGPAGLGTLQQKKLMAATRLFSSGPAGDFIRSHARNSALTQTLFCIAGVLICFSGAAMKRLKKKNFLTEKYNHKDHKTISQ